jgi:HPt (histidine-containing phosphotransfer) domain-containing protein
LTASYVPENGQLLFEAGMDNYVSKPFAAKHIQRLLRYSSTARVQSDSSLNPMPAVESVQQVLDAQLGIQQVGGNPESYRELLTDFIYELPEKLQRVRKYCEAQNMQELSRAAHNLKGVAANLGVTQIFNLALRLEQQSNGSYTESLWGTIRDLELAAEILSGYTKDLPDKSDE